MQFADLGEQFRILVDILEEKRIDSAEFLDTVLADFDDDLDNVLPMPVDFLIRRLSTSLSFRITSSSSFSLLLYIS